MAMAKRKREEVEAEAEALWRTHMEIVWQTPANPPQPHDYIFKNGKRYVRPYYFEFICHVKNRWTGKTVADFFTANSKADLVITMLGPSNLEGFKWMANWLICRILLNHHKRLATFYTAVACILRRSHLFQIEAGLLQKECMAKVVGVFPEGEQVVNAHVNYNAREGRSTVEIGDLQNGEAIKGKPALTKFTRISTNATTILSCIRVHLQYTGHPIANDMLYLSKDVIPRSIRGTGADKAAAPSALNPPPTSDLSSIDLQNNVNDEVQADQEFGIDPIYTNCPNLGPIGYEVNNEALWLHCVCYTGPGWSYECPYPDWAY